MKQINLPVTDAPDHKFLGEIVGFVGDEVRVTHRGTLSREMVQYRLYLDQYESFLLYEHRRNVGTSDVTQTVRFLDSIAQLNTLLPDAIAERLLNQFLDTIKA